MTPALYMSKRSGVLSCHRMGDSIAATGSGGARGVCAHASAAQVTAPPVASTITPTRNHRPTV